MNLEKVLNEYSKMVAPKALRLLSSFVDKKYQELVKYQILAGGKRLRPVLTILCCRLLGGNIKDVLWPALGLEILHNYTLILDDIIDNSKLRRNKPTLWFKYGKSLAQCVGVDYSAAIFQSANRSKNPVTVSELFAKTLKEIMDGEIMDILFEQSGREEEPYIVGNRYRKITQNDYFKMVGKKTASLFETCCFLGGLSAGAFRKELRSLKNYGFNLGIAFQITDDILDIFGKEQEFGKIIGGDIVERKMGNIVILLAMQEMSEADQRRFLEIIRQAKINQKDVKEGIKLIEKTNSKKRSEFLAKSFVEKAKNSLDNLPQNKWNNILKVLADYIAQRKK